MLKIVDVLRSVMETAVSSGATRVENIHNLVVDYARGYIEGDQTEVDRDSIYQLVRDITTEIGGFSDDLLDVADDVRASITRKDEV